MAKLKIIKATNFFKVISLLESEKEMCFDFVKNYCIRVSYQGNKRSIDTYAAADHNKEAFRFHINVLESFINFAGRYGYRKDDIIIEDAPSPAVPKFKNKMRDSWKLRKDQIPVHQYLMAPVGVKNEWGFYPEGTNSRQRLVGLEPGGGKTMIACTAIADWGYKPLVIVLAQYVPKWVGDFEANWECDRSEILAVSGVSVPGATNIKMKALTELAAIPGALDEYKAIVISNKTFETYLNSFKDGGIEGMKADGYMVPPDELMVAMGVGIKLVDEVHQHFLSQFRIELYSNVLFSISLSATLLSSDKDVEAMYEIGYPKRERYNQGELNKFINCYATTYRINGNFKLRTSERGQSSYSQNAYEGSILKYPSLMTSYAGMVKYCIDNSYVKNYKPGDKAIVFCSSIAMCTAMSEKLQEHYPNYSVKRYVGLDDYETNYKAPDIRVTTIGSGGTGHDLKGLTANVMTNCIDSQQGNIQTMGRLRFIPDRDTDFFFFTNMNIPKQVKYLKNKKVLFKDRVKKFANIDLGPIPK